MRPHICCLGTATRMRLSWTSQILCFGRLTHALLKSVIRGYRGKNFKRKIQDEFRKTLFKFVSCSSENPCKDVALPAKKFSLHF